MGLYSILPGFSHIYELKLVVSGINSNSKSAQPLPSNHVCLLWYKPGIAYSNSVTFKPLRNALRNALWPMIALSPSP